MKEVYNQVIRDHTVIFFSETAGPLRSKDEAIIIFVVKFEYNYWCL